MVSRRLPLTVSLGLLRGRISYRLRELVRANRELTAALLLIVAYLVLTRLGLSHHYLVFLVFGILAFILFLRNPFIGFLGFVVATQLFEYTHIGSVTVGRVYGVLLIILTIAYFTLYRHEFRERLRSAFDTTGRLMLVMLFSYTLSTVVNPNPQLIFFQRHVMFLAIFLLTRVYIDDEKKLARVLILLVLLQGFNALYGISQFAQSGGLIRATGFWRADPNEYACYSLAVLPLGLYLAPYVVTRRMKVLIVVAACLAGVSVIISASRSGFLVLASMGVLAMFIRSISLKARLVALIIALIIIGLLATSVYWSRIETVQSFLLGEEEEASLAIRQRIARDAFVIFMQNPLFGTGYTHFRQTPIEEVGGFVIHRLRLATHSMYLSSLTEFGLIGFIPFILLIFIILRNGYRGARIALRHGDRRLALLCTASAMAFLSICIFGTMLNTDTKFLYFYMALPATAWELVVRRYGAAKPATTTPVAPEES